MSSFLAGPDPPTPVAFQHRVKSITEVQPGQHLLIKTRKPLVKSCNPYIKMKWFWNPQQHFVVKSCNPDKNEFTAFKKEGEKITETTMKIPATQNEHF